MEMEEGSDTILQFEKKISEVIPPSFKQLFNNNGCPSVSCTCKSSNLYDLGCHWKRKHVKVIPFYYCPSKRCVYRTYNTHLIKKHFMDKHSQLRYADRLRNAVFEENEYFQKPVLPSGASKKEHDTSSSDSEDSDVSTSDDDTVVKEPRPFLKDFRKGRGCPYVGCKSASRRFTKVCFLSHCNCVHKRIVPQYKCPAASCNRYSKRKAGLEIHVKRVHPQLQPEAVKESRPVHIINRSYIPPVLPRSTRTKLKSSIRKPRPHNSTFLGRSKRPLNDDSEDGLEEEWIEGAVDLHLPNKRRLDEYDGSTICKPHLSSSTEDHGSRQKMRDPASSGGSAELRAEIDDLHNKQDGLEQRPKQQKARKYDGSSICKPYLSSSTGDHGSRQKMRDPASSGGSAELRAEIDDLHNKQDGLEQRPKNALARNGGDLGLMEEVGKVTKIIQGEVLNKLSLTFSKIEELSQVMQRVEQQLAVFQKNGNPDGQRSSRDGLPDNRGLSNIQSNSLKGSIELSNGKALEFECHTVKEFKEMLELMQNL